MDINLQTIYNIVSLLGFAICIYKIQKIEYKLSILQLSSVINSMATHSLLNTLKNKEIIEDKDLEEVIANFNEYK